MFPCACSLDITVHQKINTREQTKIPFFLKKGGPQFAQAAAAARAAPTPLPSSALTNRTPIRRPRSVFKHASILSLNLGYFAYSVPSTACADQTSVKRELLEGQKRPSICGLLRACPRPHHHPLLTTFPSCPDRNFENSASEYI